MTSCQDPQMSEAVKTVAPSILHMLTFPHDMLVSLYKDNLNPLARYTFSDMLNIWVPFRIWNAHDTPHSCTFFVPNVKYPEFTFKNGHINRWREIDRFGKDPFFKVMERVAIFFENPMESNGFWYPTVIRMTPAPTPWPYPAMSEGFLDRGRTVLPVESNRKGQLRIGLSNVTVSVK